MKFLFPTKYKINIEDNENGKIDIANNIFKNKKEGRTRIIPTKIKIKENVLLSTQFPLTAISVLVNFLSLK